MLRCELTNNSFRPVMSPIASYLRFSFAMALLVGLVAHTWFANTSLAAEVTTTLSAAPSTVDLTASGTTDWAYWGDGTLTASQSKSGSDWINHTMTGGTASGFNDGQVGLSWTDGTPTLSQTTTPGSTPSTHLSGQPGPLTMTVDALSGYTHTLNVILGGWGPSGTYTVDASFDAGNGSVSDLDSFVMPGGFGLDNYRAATVEYTPDVDGTLTLDWSHSGGTNVFISAATLQTQTVPEPTSVAIWIAIGLVMSGFVFLRRRRKQITT